MRKYHRVCVGILVCVMCLTAVGIAQDCTPEENSGAVTGYALFEGQSFHVGIYVYLIRLDGTLPMDLRKRTNEAGAYCFPRSVPAGKYKIRAIAPDYVEKYSEPFQVSIGKTTKVSALSLPRKTGDLEGFVLLEGQTDHSGTVVEIQSTTFATQTRKDGFWHFTNVPAHQGWYTLWASHDCFERTRIRTDVTVTAGQVNSLRPETLPMIPVSRSDCKVWCYIDDQILELPIRDCDRRGGMFFIRRDEARKYQMMARRKLTEFFNRDQTIQRSLGKLYIIKPKAEKGNFQLQMQVMRVALENAQVKQTVILLLRFKSGSTIDLGTYHPDRSGDKVYFSQVPEQKVLPTSFRMDTSSTQTAAVLVFQSSVGREIASFNTQLHLKQ